MTELCPSRRTLLRGLGAVVIAPGVLVACSSGNSGSDDTGSGDTGSGGTSSSDAGSGGGSASASVPVADVAVGEARVVDAGGQRVVVAQPTEGEFVAFSATCTHQGTTVQGGDGLTLTCPNHGSQFDAGDGAAVLTGPATAPLASVPVVVEGDRLVLG